MSSTLSNRLIERNLPGLALFAAKRIQEIKIADEVGRVQALSEEKYLVFNVDLKTKAPITLFPGKTMKDWTSMNHAQLTERTIIHEGFGFGVNLGLQENTKRIMSLDFDSCGSKCPSTGQRLGCPVTAAKLTEYIENIDRLDGMFSSSTNGNFNVLIDYTANQEVIELVASIASSKFNVAGLEILLSGNQVLPPTVTVCKMTGKPGQPRTYLNEKQFYEITAEDGFIVEFIKKLALESGKLQPKKKFKKNDIPTSTCVEPIDSKEVWMDLLFNVIKNEVVDGAKKVSWDNWFKIKGILLSNGYDREVFLKYSMPIATEEEANQLWETNKKTLQMSMFGLQNIAKEVNPNGYMTWLMQNNQTIPLAVLDKGENDIAKYLAEQLRGTLVFCVNWWQLNDFGLWVESKKPPLGKIITHAQELIEIGIKNASIEKAKIDIVALPEAHAALAKKENSYRQHYTKVGSPARSKHIATILEEYLLDVTFTQNLDNSPYTIAYKNGILDLKTLKFRNGVQASDMLSKTLDFDYEVAPSEAVAYVREQMKKICNYNESHTEYYLGALGHAMTGDSSALCQLYYLAGQSASNGKSTVLEILTSLCPQYVCTTDKNVFDADNAKAHKEIATWSGKRIVWADELSPANKNSELLKKIADGSSIKYDKLYGTNELMSIQFKLFLVSNHSLTIKLDGGITRRVRHLQMDSKFISKEEGWIEDDYTQKKFLKDETLIKTMTTVYKSAFLQLIFEHSHKFHLEGLAPYPEDWKAEKAAIEETNDVFRDFFETHFIVGEHLLAPKQVVEARLKSIGNFKVRDEMKRLGIKFDYDSQKRKTIDSVAYKGFYIGFGLRLPTEDDDIIQPEPTGDWLAPELLGDWRSKNVEVTAIIPPAGIHQLFKIKKVVRGPSISGEDDEVEYFDEDPERPPNCHEVFLKVVRGPCICGCGLEADYYDIDPEKPPTCYEIQNPLKKTN